MKHRNSFFIAFLIVADSGCATRSVVLSPVGPAHSVAARTGVPEGVLMVYSAQDVEMPQYWSYPHHSGYSLHAAEGKKLKYINNREESRGQEPEKVNLPPGRYHVAASARTFGKVSVPVVLEADKTTFVHLDGSGLGGASPNSTAEVVSLPDGLSVGWRAKDDGQKK